MTLNAEESAQKLKNNYNACISSLTWSLEKAKIYAEKFDQCIQEAIELRGKGVEFNHKQNPIKACDSYCSQVPNGNESGNYYSIDLGGSTLRAVCVKLHGNGSNSTVHKKLNIKEVNKRDKTPKGLLDKNTPAAMLFDAIASLVKELMIEVGDNPSDERSVSFTFSFPLSQHGLNRGELLHWTKEFETGTNTYDPVEGQDVAELLNASFKRFDMNATVGALTNDTIGTLLSAGYENNQKLPTTRLGIILGTGFNIASYEPSANQHNYNGNLINYECGNYNGVKGFLSMMDLEVDYYSSARGSQLAEKVIGGHYLGELCRLSFVKVFQHRCTQETWNRWSFPTRHAAAIYSDNTKKYRITQKVLKDRFNWLLTDEEELRMAYKIVSAIFDRSATVAALMTAVLANRTRYLQGALGGVTVGVDGSVYLENPKYQKTYRKTLDKILGARAHLLHVVPASDGSGKGAAVLAACLDNKKKEP